MARPWTVQDAVAHLARRFDAAGLPTPGLDARLLVMHVCELTREALVLDHDRPVRPEEAAWLEAARERRLAREPVSRIVGRREFWGRSFVVGPATLDPRPDSETLVETVLALVDRERRREAPLRILDLGTGTGCLLLTLLAELPNAAGVGTDLDFEALRIARRNAVRLGLDTRAGLVRADWLAGIGGPFDIVIANPPYVSHGEMAGLAPEVSRHDPPAALDGGTDGLNAYRRITAGLRRVAAPRAWAVFEAGRGQAAAVAGLLEGAGFGGDARTSVIGHDLGGVARVVAGKRQYGNRSSERQKNSWKMDGITLGFP